MDTERKDSDWDEEDYAMAAKDLGMDAQKLEDQKIAALRFYFYGY
jgi:hypothetical protein